MKLDKLYESIESPIIPMDIRVEPEKVTLYFTDSFTYNHYHAKSDGSLGIISTGVDPGDYIEFSLKDNQAGNLEGELKIYEDDNKRLRNVDGWEATEQDRDWARKTLQYFLKGLYKQFRKKEVDEIKSFIEQKIS